MFSFFKDRTFIKNYIRITCEKNHVPELYNEIGYSFVNSLPDRFSQCYPEPKIKLIEFSIELWDQASEKERRNAIVHETAHIIARYKYGSEIEHHGEEWVGCMQLTGEVAHIIYRKEGSG